MHNEPEISSQLVKDHGLTTNEYKRILDLIGRTPNFTELGIFSVMWSEHCSYKSSKKYLRKLPTKNEKVIQGPGENAGISSLADVENAPEIVEQARVRGGLVGIHHSENEREDIQGIIALTLINI